MNRSEALQYSLNRWFTPEEGAVEVLYNGQPMWVHVSYGDESDPTSQHAKLTIRVSDVPNPQYRDSITIDGEVWRVFSNGGEVIYSGDGYVYEIPLIRKERPRAF